MTVRHSSAEHPTRLDLTARQDVRDIPTSDPDLKERMGGVAALDAGEGEDASLGVNRSGSIGVRSG